MAPRTDEQFRQALSAMQSGQADTAERLFRQVLKAQPKHVGALNLLSILLTGQGRFEEAERYSRLALKEDARSDVTFYNYGLILKALKRPAEAFDRFSQALKIKPSVAETWCSRGAVLNELKRYGEAIADFDRAIAINANYPDAFLNKGNALTELKSYADAVVAYDRALSLKPDLAEAWFGRGNVFVAGKQYGDAITAYGHALAIKPDLAGAWLARGIACAELNRRSDALAAYDRALAQDPNLAVAWTGRGNVLTELKQCHDASAAYARALALQPEFAEAWLGQANVLFELGRYEEAVPAYDRALKLKPGLAEAWLGRGSLLAALKQYGEAFAAYDRALALKPDLAFAEGDRLHTKLQICDWTDLEAETARLLAGMRAGRRVCSPFAMLSLPSSAADQLQSAKIFLADQPALAPARRGGARPHDRIRIAYLSADFYEHAATQLVAALFERHDRARFEVTGISFGPRRQSAMRQRLEGAFEHFIDVAGKTDQEIAELIQERGIDIAIDLMGFTKNNRLGVLARRPAPIQVNYLGFIGTMGAEFIDYVLADAIALPLDQQPFFAEKIVHLPDSFLPTDGRQEIAAWTPSREEAGLPADGFVFCSFNNSYKLAKPVFERWMRLLQAVDGSVLWLAEANVDLPAHLQREATRLGVDPVRLIFAPVLPLPRHLARQRLAGLFLDTVPYNAGATAAAALWSGVPLLTVAGETFVGRMAASMLHAVGLPELVTHNLDDYEALALRLARDPALLAGVRLKLHDNLAVMPLFDTDRFRRNIEQAYKTMLDIQRRGEGPRSFAVEPV